jgi:sialic acid synthase SpsE
MDDNKSTNFFKIDGVGIGQNQPVFIIAEVGINHNGDARICRKLIEAAAKAGADAVKLQIVNAAECYVSGTDSYAEFSGTVLDEAVIGDMMGLSKELGIILFATPGDFKSLDQMCRLGMQAVKISSGLITNLPLIAEVAKRGLPMIISSGMAYKDEIELAISTAQQNGCPGLALLKCTALYPASDDTVNLYGMVSMGKRFGIPVGYSDHTIDNLACLSAVVLGAKVIEKHFTLDKKCSGADHHISMEPEDYLYMVRQIRRISEMFGNGEIAPVDAEVAVREQRHRCLIARKPIAAGDVLNEENVGLKRPIPGFHGLPVKYYSNILGKRAICDIAVDQPIGFHNIQGLV